MYPQSQQNYSYPQQPGFAYPGQQQPATYPPQPGGPSVQLKIGQPLAGGFGGLGDPAGLFAEKAIRQAFVSKVFSILTVQLLFTAGMIAAFVFSPENKQYFGKTPAGAMWMLIGLAIFFITYLILVCIESARRSTPVNFILLSVMTIGYSVLAAVISCQYSTTVVMGAFLATGISCLLIAAFAKSTSFDMTNCGTTLCLLALAHMIVGIILILVLPVKTANLIMALSGALLVSLYLVFDIQLIMGGRKCELSPEEYILGAIMLYTDIMQLFLYMLQILNRLSDD